jgi:hypothetical protein
VYIVWISWNIKEIIEATCTVQGRGWEKKERKKLYVFRTVPLSIIRSFLLYTHSNGISHTGLLTACEQDQDGTAVPS